MDTIEEIKRFVVAEFVPDITVADLDTDYDLVAGGVIDSLGFLKVLAWLEDRFELDSDAVELDPDRFRSVGAIAALVEDARVKAS
jgi:acyl carrier protein